MKKGIKFRDSSVLNLILFFNLLNFLKYRVKMKQEKPILTHITCTVYAVIIKDGAHYYYCAHFLRMPG